MVKAIRVKAVIERVQDENNAAIARFPAEYEFSVANLTFPDGRGPSVGETVCIDNIGIDVVKVLNENSTQVLADYQPDLIYKVIKYRQ